MEQLVTLTLKLPRETEVTVEAAKTFLASLNSINKFSFVDRIKGKKPKALSLEIVLINQQIFFQIVCDISLVPFVEAQIQANYPLVVIQKNKQEVNFPEMEVVKLSLKSGSYYPLNTFVDFKDVDPISGVLGVLAKGDSTDAAIIQIALQSISSSWQKGGLAYAQRGTKKEDGTYTPRSDAEIIKQKVNEPGFKTSIRIASNNKDLLSKIIASFSVFANPEGNSFSPKKGIFPNKKGLHKAFTQRVVNDNQVMNINELATIWHLPSMQIKTLGIVWGAKVLSEPPINLPTSDVNQEARDKINYFGRTTFKNKDAIFGIKDIDRRRHVWAIGKTGTGKSTLLENMAVDDLKKDRGICYIDPHGDACEVLLEYIPKRRINDVVYFNPSDKGYPISINPLEVTNKEEAELVVSGIVSVFNKIFGFSWGPRLEYVLRNSLLTLSEVPNSTLMDVPSLLTNKNFRERIVAKITDPTLKDYWINEFEKMPPNLQKESISPILNKVGQFVTSPMIRQVISSPKSSIRIDEIMDQGKILLVNLSQGRLGEDNAALLGAMIITKIQLAAMHRVDMPEADRRDFYLYVDEFQNFATTSFIKILSEARKYRLNLLLANQYIAQIPEEVQKAILGNAGSIISFSIGASDASILFKEFAEVFKETDLINLQNYQIAIKLMVDGHSQRPFFATTLPLPESRNQNKETVIRVSRERWGKKV